MRIFALFLVVVLLFVGCSLPVPVAPEQEQATLPSLFDATYPSLDISNGVLSPTEPTAAPTRPTFHNDTDVSEPTLSPDYTLLFVATVAAQPYGRPSVGDAQSFALVEDDICTYGSPLPLSFSISVDSQDTVTIHFQTENCYLQSASLPQRVDSITLRLGETVYVMVKSNSAEAYYALWLNPADA